MTDLSARASGPPLSESYLECIQSFGLFVQALSEDDCRVVHLEQIQLSEILEGYGRIKIWGDQSKAELPARARGSLDDTLRHDDELRSLVQGILTRLKAILGQATYIARRKYDPAVGSDHDSISSVSANSDSDSDEGGEHQRHRMPKICLLVQQTLEQIRSLFDLSALLRRPKIADKYIRSVDSKSHTATLSDPEILPINLGFSSSDEGHIVEKMLQWRGLTKSGQCIQFEDEEVTPTGQGLTYDRVEDVMWFCKRLAGANTRRREQLQYWADHPYDHKKATTDIPVLDAPNLEQVVAKQMREPQKSQSQASTLKPPKSTVSKQSFSTAAVSDIYDTKTNVRPRTVYAPTTIGQGRYSSVPDPPRMEDGKTTFLCPYCGMTLESSEMKNRQVWKRHVYRDLRPYVCTFEECQNAGKLYVNRHDWMYHELQIHRRKYVCRDCHKICSSRQEMSTHVQKHYSDSISLAQLSVILDLCNHQVDISDNENDTCLVCGMELSLSELQGHLATHMEEIALFVLPSSHEAEELGGDMASMQAANPKSKATNSSTTSEFSSLGFSGADGAENFEPGDLLTVKDGALTVVDNPPKSDGNEFGFMVEQLAERRMKREKDKQDSVHGQWHSPPDDENDDDKAAEDSRQTPASFSKLLTSEEADYASKFLFWGTMDEDQEWVSSRANQSTLPNEILQVMATKLEHPDREVVQAAIRILGHQTNLPDEIIQTMAAHSKDVHEGLRNDLLQILDRHSVLPEGILTGGETQSEDNALRPTHSPSDEITHNLEGVNLDQGKPKEAEHKYLRTLAETEKALGPDHTSTLNIIHNLGILYHDQGSLDKAEEMYVRVLSRYERVLGSDHITTLNMVRYLGKLYHDQAKPDQAEPMYLRALAGYEKTMGPTHPSTLHTIKNLGGLYFDQGKHNEAEPMYSRALAGYEKAVGPDHTTSLQIVQKLGTLYQDQLQLDKAEPMFLRVLAGYEKALGPDHLSTLQPINDLGSLYREQGKLNEAEQMYSRALAGYKKALGPDHPSTLQAINDLGNVHCRQDRLDEAEQMYLWALARYERTLGPDHPSTLHTIRNLGNVYRDQGKLNEAKQMQQLYVARTT